MHHYLSIFAYVGLYPAIVTFLNSVLDFDVYDIFYFNSTVFFSMLYFDLAVMFVPALLWLLVTKISKKIDPIVVILYFGFFLFIQLLVLIIEFLFFSEVWQKFIN